MDANSDPDRIDFSQAKHVRGTGTLDEAIYPEMKAYVARCLKDVQNAHDRARHLKSGGLGGGPKKPGVTAPVLQSPSTYLDHRWQQVCRTGPLVRDDLGWPCTRVLDAALGTVVRKLLAREIIRL